MAILIDADVFLHAERGIFDLDAWLTCQPREVFKISAITAAELWHGAQRSVGPHRARRTLFLQRLLATFDLVPFTAEAAFHYAHLWTELQSSGQMIGPHDLMLAATALQIDYAIATFSNRHFAVVKGLKIIKPA
jgi:predicted nucleic acid-binding protein